MPHLASGKYWVTNKSYLVLCSVAQKKKLFRGGKKKLFFLCKLKIDEIIVHRI